MTRRRRRYQELPLAGPRIVAANPPNDFDEAAAIALDAIRGGPDVADLPHLYEPYAQAAGSVAKASRPLVSLSQKGLDAAQAVNDFVTANGDGARALGYVPVKARNRDFVVVVDRKTGEIVGYLAGQSLVAIMVRLSVHHSCLAPSAASSAVSP